MRKLEMHEIAQVSGGSKWNVSTSDIPNFVRGGDDTSLPSTSWESKIKTPFNDAGVGEAIGQAVITMGKFGIGLLGRRLLGK